MLIQNVDSMTTLTFLSFHLRDKTLATILLYKKRYAVIYTRSMSRSFYGVGGNMVAVVAHHQTRSDVFLRREYSRLTCYLLLRVVYAFK